MTTMMPLAASVSSRNDWITAMYLTATNQPTNHSNIANFARTGQLKRKIITQFRPEDCAEGGNFGAN